MKSMLLVAHGSRRAESNAEIARLAERVATRAGARFAIVEHAFLELAEPSIPEGIERCLHRGASTVRVVPYFLARGTHVVDDIPEQVSIAQTRHPDADIRITDYLGTADEMAALLVELADSPAEPSRPFASGHGREH